MSFYKNTGYQFVNKGSVNPNKPKSLIAEYIRRETVDKDSNINLLISGKPGVGKSLAAIRLAMTLQEDFTVNNIVFSSRDFLLKLRSGTLKPGDVVIYDEFGVGHNARKFLQEGNMILNDVLETFRYMRIVVIYTTPDLNFIDSVSRKLLHLYIEMQKKDSKNNVSYGKVYMIENKPLLKKIYNPHPRVMIGGKHVRITDIGFLIPPPEIVKAYKAKSIDYKEQLQEKALVELGVTQEYQEGYSIEDLTVKQKKVLELYKAGHSSQEIEQVAHLSAREVKKAKNQLEALGFITKNPKERKMINRGQDPTLSIPDIKALGGWDDEVN